MSRSNERVTYLRNDRTGAEVCSPDNPPHPKTDRKFGSSFTSTEGVYAISTIPPGEKMFNYLVY